MCPPPSILSQTSAMSTGVKVSGLADDNLMEHGAISDRDETRGEEYEAKRNSPVKGGKRLTSEVSTNYLLSLLFKCTDLYLAQGKS